MDILDIFWDILLKPPQPLMGLFLCVVVLSKRTIKNMFVFNLKNKINREGKIVICQGLVREF